MEKIEQLKFNIQEKKYPYFTDEELQLMLEQNNGDVKKTSHDCLIMKSQDTGLVLSGLTTKSTSEYFKRLAQKFDTTNSGVLI